jgi:hypothetical protein
LSGRPRLGVFDVRGLLGVLLDEGAVLRRLVPSSLLAHVGDLAGLEGVGGVVVVEAVNGGGMSKKFWDFLDADFSASFTGWRMKRKREICQLQ